MKFTHVLLAILVALIWGFNFVVIKTGLDEIPPLLYGAGRYILAALPVFFIKKPNVSWSLIFGIGFTLGALKFTLLFLGIYMGVPAGLASLILQSQAFFTIGLCVYFYKATILPNHILGMVIAFLGIGLIGWQMNVESTLLGFLFICAGALAWAFSNIMYRKVGNADMFALTVWTSLIPPIPILIGEYCYEGFDVILSGVESMSLLGWLCLLYTTCASTWIGATIWGGLLRTYEPHRVAPFSLLVPIFAMSFASIILGEGFSTLKGIACVLVFLGLIVNQWPMETQRDDDKLIDEDEHDEQDFKKAA